MRTLLGEMGSVLCELSWLLPGKGTETSEGRGEKGSAELRVKLQAELLLTSTLHL